MRQKCLVWESVESSVLKGDKDPESYTGPLVGEKFLELISIAPTSDQLFHVDRLAHV